MQQDVFIFEGTVESNIRLYDENITINVIRNNEIVEKRTLELPELVTNVIKCKNPRCITSIEQELPHRFKLTDRENHIYRCMYCEQKFSRRR